MIRKHEFNTRWWGKPVGIVDDPKLFFLDEDLIKAQLEPFDWVEFKSALDAVTPLKKIAQSGFVQVDTQLPFSLNLKSIEETPSTNRLEATFADEVSINVTSDQLSSFLHERFRYLPGCEEEQVNERYALWTNELAERFPQTCLQVSMNGVVQGWFLAQPGKTHRLQLTLAMLAKNATISGMLLYQKACLEFANRGHRLGEASFSITNTAVHNMYANLKARFLAPVGQWLWLPETSGEANNV